MVVVSTSTRSLISRSVSPSFFNRSTSVRISPGAGFRRAMFSARLRSKRSSLLISTITAGISV